MAKYLVLAENTWCVTIHGITGQAIAEGWIPANTPITPPLSRRERHYGVRLEATPEDTEWRFLEYTEAGRFIQESPLEPKTEDVEGELVLVAWLREGKDWRRKPVGVEAATGAHVFRCTARLRRELSREAGSEGRVKRLREGVLVGGPTARTKPVVQDGKVIGHLIAPEN